jgi:Na+/H+ antiporter NhaA
MSIFISGLAFESVELQQIAKVGIFGASLVSAVAGLVVLGSVSKKQ